MCDSTSFVYDCVAMTRVAKVEVAMLSTFFPNQGTLKARLKKRFPVQALDPAAAKQVVTEASAASWSGEAEIKQRKADIQRALRCLESNADGEVAYLRVA